MVRPFPSSSSNHCRDYRAPSDSAWATILHSANNRMPNYDQNATNVFNHSKRRRKRRRRRSCSERQSIFPQSYYRLPIKALAGRSSPLFPPMKFKTLSHCFLLYHWDKTSNDDAMPHHTPREVGWIIRKE